MASLNFKNNGFSPISVLGEGETTLTVTDASKFPTEVPFILTIWDSTTYDEINDDPDMEVVVVTAIVGSDYTITRAAEGTSDVAHAGGQLADMVWTAGSMNDPVYGIVTKIDASVDVTASQIATLINASEEVFNEANIDSDIARDSEVTADIGTHAALPNAHHNALHAVASHSDTDATGAELETLTDGSDADALHAHAVNDAAVALNTTHRTSDGSDHTFIDQSVISGASPTLVGTNITAIPADNITFNVLGTPTYETAQDWFNVIQTAGIISGFELSNTRLATELDVAAGTGIVKSTDSEIGSSVSFNFAGVQNVTLSGNNINYIYLDYNAGTPQIVATTNRASIELNRHFIIGRVYKNGTTLHILNAGVHLPNLARNEHERLVERDGFTYVSGSITSETGTLNLAVTAGVWYLGHNRITTDALDSSVADTWIYTHYGVSSWITDDATAEAVDCTHYNSGADVITSMGPNNYGTQWVYITSDSHWYVIYGTINGTLSAAQDDTPPTTLPPYVTHMGELIAKIIHKEDGTIVAIEIAQDVKFTSSGIPNHNDTGGLQGGTADEYYHLTSAEKTLFDTVEENAAADQTASEVPIIDSGSIITATDVEDALQENRTAIDLNTAKDTNVSTDLSEGTNTETTVDVNSSDGSNATLVSASTSRAGLLTKAKFDEIVANTSKDTNVSTDLSEGTNTETTVDVNSSDGTNATLVAASTSRAGLLTKAKFDEIVANTAKVTNATHTGDVTGSVALTIAADAVTYSKMQNVVNDERILGRVSGADGVVEELTPAQVRTSINVADGSTNDSMTDGVSCGYLADITAGLNATTRKGEHVISGTGYNLAGDAHLYTASKDTYVDVSTSAYVFTEVTLGAAAPAISGTNQRIMRVVTDATNVTSIADMRTMITSGVFSKINIQTTGIIALATLAYTTSSKACDVVGINIYPLWQNDAGNRQMSHAYSELSATTEYTVLGIKNLSTVNTIPALVNILVMNTP